MEESGSNAAGSPGSESPGPESPGPGRKSPFRERGDQVTRTEAFVDAAFAFAVTLLVISFEDDLDSIDKLIGSLKQVPAFAASFTLVALIWSAHHRWSRRFGLDDTSSTLRSLLLVFLVLVWVFPLRMMFQSMFMWLSALAFPADSPLRIPFTIDLGPGGASAGLRTMFIVYGIAWCSICAVISGLYAHAWKRREAIGLDRREMIATRGEIAQWRYGFVVGLVSIAVALFLDPGRVGALHGAPGMTYFLMTFIGVAGGVAERRADRTLPARPA